MVIFYSFLYVYQSVIQLKNMDDARDSAMTPTCFVDAGAPKTVL